MINFIKIIILSLLFCAPIFSMEINNLAQDSELNIIQDLRYEDGHKYILIDVKNKSGHRLTKIKENKESLACQLCPPTAHLLLDLPEMQEIVNTVEKKLYKLKLYIDFDGVLAKPFIEFFSTKNNKIHHFNTAFLAGNSILEKQYKAAFSKTNMEPFFVELKEAAENILGPEWQLSESRKVQLSLVKKFFGFVDDGIIKQQEDFNSYKLNYQPVSHDLVNFLKIVKERGAQLYVLSARNKNNKKLEFLNSSYENIFTDYIYSINKGEVLKNAPDKKQNSVVIFIDDHVEKVGEYARTVKINTVLNNESSKHSFIFLPFPQISKEFHAKELLSEIIQLAKSADKEVCEKFRQKEIIFIKKNFTKKGSK